MILCVSNTPVAAQRRYDDGIPEHPSTYIDTSYGDRVLAEYWHELMLAKYNARLRMIRRPNGPRRRTNVRRWDGSLWQCEGLHEAARIAHMNAAAVSNCIKRKSISYNGCTFWYCGQDEPVGGAVVVMPDGTRSRYRSVTAAAKVLHVPPMSAWKAANRGTPTKRGMTFLREQRTEQVA